MRAGYQSLLVWQKAMLLTKEVYLLTESLPAKERFGLSDQIRRAAVSIPSNIAEGSKRKSKKEYGHFIHVAHGSLAELETQLLLVQGLYPDVDASKTLDLALEIGRMLYAFERSLEK
jgi:four helix bundle protein